MTTPTDEKILYIAKLHPIIFLWPMIFSLIAVILSMVFTSFGLFFLILLGFGLIWVVYTWVHWYSTSLTIKAHRIILKTGFFTRQVVDMPMTKIERVDIRQTMMGSLLRYGSLLIIGTGGSRLGIHELNDPLTPRRYIEQSLI